MASKSQSTPDWQRLQRKIFSRWANQKLIKKKIPVEDVVNEIQSGLMLVALMEVLADKNFVGWSQVFVLS
jgi:hypothetical protein